MDQDIVVFDLIVTQSEWGQEQWITFAALRIHNEALQKSVVLDVGASSLRMHFQDILEIFENAVLVGAEGALKLKALEQQLNFRFPQLVWDVLELIRIFFPTLSSYSLPYLAEKLEITPLACSTQDASRLKVEEHAWITWRLLQVCWKKGLAFDLSFFDQAKHLLEGWTGRGFIDQLQKMVSRRFPDRRIRTDLVLAPEPETPTEGLFNNQLKMDAPLPQQKEWVIHSFSPGGIFEQNLPGYESRPGQVEMVKQVVNALVGPHHVVVEAGTGTGKSFAYLLPSLWLAKRLEQRVVIATHTIPLQEQLLKKDIPVLERVLPFSFRAAVLKGKGNYGCLKKWQSCLGNVREIQRLEHRLALLSLLVWLRETPTGDIQELAKIPGLRQIWPLVNAENEACIPAKCSHAGVCFLLRARKKAEEADILIVNHSLLFSDLKTDFNVLPEYHYLVIDEAHQIHQAALQHLGAELSLELVERTVENIYRSVGPCFYGTLKQRWEQLVERAPMVAWDVFQTRMERLPESSRLVLDQARELFRFLAILLGPQRNFRFTARHLTEPWWSNFNVQVENLIGRIKALVSIFESLVIVLKGEEADDAEELQFIISGHQRACDTLLETLTLAMEIHHPKQVTWLEQSPRLSLKTSPVDVSEILREKVFSRLDAAILTSATLSIADSFEHLLRDIGLPRETITARVASPFDYDLQMRFFVVKNEGNAQRMPEEKVVELSEFIVEVAQKMRGRTLVLFTSHQFLKETHAVLQERLARIEIDVLAQGIDGDRAALLEAFKRNPQSVLLGANSFWEGIDLPGDTLSCVIMVKLPFWPPTLPLIEARSEFVKSQGRDPFNEFLLPEAVIRFKQGFGRLIRSKADRGVVILLDSRVIEKPYGRQFLSSLPIHTHLRGENQHVFRKIEQWMANEVE